MIALPAPFPVPFSALVAMPLRLLRTYPWQTGCALLALCLWWQHQRAADWQKRARTEAASHQLTKAHYHAAQQEAAERARTARIETEARYRQMAQEADDANEQADSWRARAGHFADGGGLRPKPGTCAAGAPGDAGTGAEVDLAARGDGSGAATVTLSREDFDTLSANTERLLKVHAWGKTLIAQGLAEPASD